MLTPFVQIGFGLHDTGFVTAFPQAAGAAVEAVDVLHVATTDGLHEARGGCGFSGGHQEVHVVGHEDVGVDGTAPIASRLFEPVEVAVVVLFSEKAGLAIDAALDDVQRGFGELDAGATGHVSGLENQLMLTPFVLVRELSNKGEGTGLGAIAGGVLGGLLGSQIGGGHGKTAMAVVGAAGGAFAGHEVEKRVRGETQYEVTVRFDDGRTHTYTEAQAPQLRSGDRVRFANGHLMSI